MTQQAQAGLDVEELQGRLQEDSKLEVHLLCGAAAVSKPSVVSTELGPWSPGMWNVG